jgi:hypothetical protein
MAGRWKEVVRLRFKGDRFRDHALDLSALSELTQFQKMVAETAKTLWRAANPNRERMPSHFEDRTRLCLREIHEGSAVAPLEVYIEEPPERTLWEPEPVEVNEAVSMAYEVFEALEKDIPLPERLPKSLVAEYAKWGHSLAEDEEIEFEPPGRPPTRLKPAYSKRLATFGETPYEDQVDIGGEVFEADVRQRKFHLWTADQSPVQIMFSDEQEQEVTTALKEHRTARMHVRGRGEISPQGKLMRVIDVEVLEIQKIGEDAFDTNAPSIEQVLRSLANEVPQNEWSLLPEDLTDNLDNFLYGTQKR